MPSYVVKPDRDRDFYVMWSTVVDNVTMVGQRADFLAHPDVDEQRMERADAQGTSALNPREYGWGDETFLVANIPTANGFGMLPRSLLVQFSLLMVERREAEAAALLGPVDVD